MLSRKSYNQKSAYISKLSKPKVNTRLCLEAISKTLFPYKQCSCHRKLSNSESKSFSSGFGSVPQSGPHWGFSNWKKIARLIIIIIIIIIIIVIIKNKK